MTREQIHIGDMSHETAIGILKLMLEAMETYDGISPTTERINAVKMAIESLAMPSVTPQPCEDAVSRQEVLDLIADYDLSMGQVVRGIHALPPVTPQPRWIPVSERLPEDHTNVLFCDIDGDVMLGYHIPREQKAHFVERGSWDMVKNVVAWMPLPESYKEVKDGN